MAADIQVTANNDFLAANPAAKALFETVKLSVIDVSVANAEQVTRGRHPTLLAEEWIADNRSLVDPWLEAARAAGPGPAGDVDPEPDTPDTPPTPAGADPSACRPPGVHGVTAGFPLPAWASPSIGTFRIGVLFLDFADAPAAHSTRDEAALGLPYAEEYLEAVSLREARRGVRAPAPVAASPQQRRPLPRRASYR